MPLWQRHVDPPVVEHVRHALPAHLGRLGGTRIVQVSDLHVGRDLRAPAWAAHVERINALRPDVVVITGDAMDWARRYASDYVEPLSGLRPRLESLAILGNHDFYFGGELLARLYREHTRVTLLRRDVWSHAELPGLRIFGFDDPMTSLAAPSAYPELQAWSGRVDPDTYNVLLSHRPDAFPVARRIGFDLQLSGHTHGGQISLSLPNGDRLHIARVLGRYDRGSFEHARGDGRVSRLYVNRGLGYAAVPYRRDCPSEITLHELCAAS